MRGRAVILAAAIVIAPLGAHSADLVVWWGKGAYPKEDEAVREIIAAFEQETGKEIELVLYPEIELPGEIAAALNDGRPPPDFAFSIFLNLYVHRWAFEDRLEDLTDTIGSFSSLFDPAHIARAVALNAKTGQRALYALPMGFTISLVHVWRSLLEQAGLSLDDIPKQWEAFWAFWCDQVQPAVRRATGRNDIYGVGLSMAAETGDTITAFFEFIDAYQADYVTRDGQLVIDDPETRRKLIKALDSYTEIYRKGCTPPDSSSWDAFSNNRAFINQKVVVTTNLSLSIPNALKNQNQDDYYKNAVTIPWTVGPSGELFPIQTIFYQAVAFAHGPHVDTAKAFVRFLVAEGWLMHYLDFSGERMLPSIQALLDQPFWLDTSDPHQMATVIQAKTRPLAHDYGVASGNPRHDNVFTERVWAKAVHRVAAEGISPEQAVDEAIARIKQILAE